RGPLLGQRRDALAAPDGDLPPGPVGRDRTGSRLCGVSAQGWRAVTADVGLQPDEPAELLRLAAALVAIPSVSLEEEAVAGWIEARLRARAPSLRVDRIGNCVVARTDRGLRSRVILSGHVDTVPGAASAGLE